MPCILFCSFGWLRFGRYEMIKFGSLISFLASILYYFALLTTSTLSTVLFSAAVVIINLSGSCYYAAMLPFLTDQLTGATSDELSTVIRWYYWALYAGIRKEISEPNLIISYLPNLSQPKEQNNMIKAFWSKQDSTKVILTIWRHSEANKTPVLPKCWYTLTLRQLIEKIYSWYHIRSNSIFLLQQVLSDLHHHWVWPKDCGTLGPAMNTSYEKQQMHAN